MWNIIKYEKASGKCPINDFLLEIHRSGKKMKDEKMFDLFEGIDKIDNKTKEEINDLTNIISKLTKIREEQKISQRDLANITGIKQPMIARIETLNTVPRIDTLIKIANALGCKIEIVSRDKD